MICFMFFIYFTFFPTCFRLSCHLCSAGYQWFILGVWLLLLLLFFSYYTCLHRIDDHWSFVCNSNIFSHVFIIYLNFKLYYFLSYIIYGSQSICCWSGLTNRDDDQHWTEWSEKFEAHWARRAYVCVCTCAIVDAMNENAQLSVK